MRTDDKRTTKSGKATTRRPTAKNDPVALAPAPARGRRVTPSPAPAVPAQRGRKAAPDLGRVARPDVTPDTPVDATVWGAVHLPDTLDASRYGSPLADDLSDVLGIPDPAHVRLPLGPVPTKAADVEDWMDRYRAQLELARAGLELRKALADAAGYGELKRLERRTKELEADATVRRAALELSDPHEALVYTFFAAVEEESVRDAVRELSAWSRRAPGRPIRLVLNSPGGSVLDGLALFDFLGELRSRGHHLQVLALGTAASMGGVLLQAGSERLLGRNAFVLVHEVRGGAIGPSSSIGDTVEFIGRLEERLLSILAERSVLSADQIRERWGRRDWWLTAEEAVALGFADAVV